LNFGADRQRGRSGQQFKRPGAAFVSGLIRVFLLVLQSPRPNFRRSSTWGMDLLMSRGSCFWVAVARVRVSCFGEGSKSGIAARHFLAMALWPLGRTLSDVPRVFPGRRTRC